MMISLIIPFRNEKESIQTLFTDCVAVLDSLGTAYEIVFVDDGSDDGGGEIARTLAEGHENVKFFRNPVLLGKGGALSAGLTKASGDRIIFIDADFQNNPSDIPRFLRMLEEGNDLVNGWRKNQTADALTRLYTRSFNWFLRTFLGSPFHDENCGYKIFRRSVLDKVSFYAADFRMFPLAVRKAGFRVAEMPIVDRPKIYGHSKFGPFKFIGGVRDIFLFVVFRKRWLK